VDEYRLTWKLAGISARKKIERMRTFFKFCMARGWTEKNPAKDLDVPDASFSPTLPVEDADFEKLVAATARYPKKGICGEKTGERVKAFLLLLRYSGLRIGDVVRLKRKNIQGNKLLIRTAKTKVNVWLPCPSSSLNRCRPAMGRTIFGQVLEIRSHASRIGRDRSSAWLKSRGSKSMRTCSEIALRLDCSKTERAWRMSRCFWAIA